MSQLTEARIYRLDVPEDWSAFLAARDSGQRVEIDEEMAYYWLEVLPPVFMFRDVYLDGGPRRVWFGFAEGEERITAFWRQNGRFFAQLTSLVNRGG